MNRKEMMSEHCHCGEKPSGMPLLGSKLPEMEVVTTQGKKNIPGDYEGKWLVLFSHPADFTPVCTTEFYAFASRQNEFDDLDCELLGLSIDQVQSHLKWLEWIETKLKMKIKFPVIADDRGQVAEKLGMLHPGKGSNTVRAVFVIDPTGTIRTILYYPQELGRNMDEIVRVVQALQIADKEKVAMPANWPKNELIGDNVIVPPAADVETMNARKNEPKSYDWWLVYRDLND